MSIENPDFLKEKYNLHTSPEVESAADRTEARTGEPVPQDPAARIQNYLERFTGILEREDPHKRERGIEAVKRVLHDKFVIKPEEIPEGYFENQRRIAREQGHGDIEISPEMRIQHSEVIITDQETTLDTWIDYLSSKDAPYPDWLKYYAIRSVLGMGAYDKETHQFAKRSKGTTKPFPDLNREALAYVLDVLDKKYAGEGIDLSSLEDQDRTRLEKLLEGENFAKLYAFAIDKVTPASKEALESVEGQWVKYDQGSDHMPLARSLQGHGTGWCTMGESTAEAQLKNGDFYVFYSLDQQGQPTIPRVAIRMEEGGIAEVRGVADEQNLDPAIAPVVEAKLREFPDGSFFAKKTADMKQLTEIDQAVKSGKSLAREQLRFLYELDTKIEGFGYHQDPRIPELLNQRNRQADLAEIFDASPSEIAHLKMDLKDTTKLFFGDLTITKQTKLPASLKWIDGSVEISGRVPPNVAEKLVEIGLAKTVVDHLEHFVGLDHQVLAERLFKVGEGLMVSVNLQSFSKLDQSIATKLIEMGEGYGVVKNLGSFLGLDHEVIAKKLIETGKGWVLADSLHLFPGLDRLAIAQKLIDHAQGMAVAQNLNKFTGLDLRSLFSKLIETGEGQTLVDNLDAIHGLDDATKEWIRKKYRGQ